VPKYSNIVSRSKIFSFILIVLSTNLIFSNLGASTGVSIGSGFGAANIVPLRLAFQQSFDKHWNQKSDWPIGAHWEASIYNMNGHRGLLPNSHKQLNAASLALALRFERLQETMLGWPYLELGLGLSGLSRKEIGGRKLGMHILFEDKFGLGLRFGEKRQFDFSYKALHFSNAYLGSFNHGINLHMLILGYWFD